MEHLLGVMRDEEQPTDVRLDAAITATPYCHARLAARHVTAMSDDGMSHEGWLKELEQIVDCG